jgi:hypothetical protein
MGELFGELLKQLHDHSDVGRVMFERVRRFNELSAIPVLEHYRKSGLSWIFDVRAPIILEESVGPHLPTLGVTDELIPVYIFELYSNDGGRFNRWNTKPVLISEVEFVYGPYGRIPSTVGLYLAYKKVGKSRGGTIYRQFNKPVFQAFHGAVTRERSLLPPLIGNESGDGVEPNIIESAFEIVDGITEDDGKIIFQGDDILPTLVSALEDFKSGVRVYMDFYNQAFFQRVDTRFKVSDVLVGTCDLATGTYAGVH